MSGKCVHVLCDPGCWEASCREGVEDFPHCYKCGARMEYAGGDPMPGQPRICDWLHQPVTMDEAAAAHTDSWLPVTRSVVQE